MIKLETKTLFDLDRTHAKPLLEACTFPWEALPQIGDFIIALGEKLPKDLYEQKGKNVWIAKSATVFPSAYIDGPCIIGENTQVRHCAFIRGNALVGNDCVVGNSTELKNVILFDNVQVPHFNYVGDSIFGYKAHTGAGAITSNVKQDQSKVSLKIEDIILESGLKKFGAILGDNVEIGCNTVMNPGTVVGKNSRVYPLSMVRGFVPSNSIYKNNGDIIDIKKSV